MKQRMGVLLKKNHTVETNHNLGLEKDTLRTAFQGLCRTAWTEQVFLEDVSQQLASTSFPRVTAHSSPSNLQKQNKAIKHGLVLKNNYIFLF